MFANIKQNSVQGGDTVTNEGYISWKASTPSFVQGLLPHLAI